MCQLQYDASKRGSRHSAAALLCKGAPLRQWSLPPSPCLHNLRPVFWHVVIGLEVRNLECRVHQVLFTTKATAVLNRSGPAVSVAAVVLMQWDRTATRPCRLEHSYMFYSCMLVQHFRVLLLASRTNPSSCCCLRVQCVLRTGHVPHVHPVLRRRTAAGSTCRAAKTFELGTVYSDGKEANWLAPQVRCVAQQVQIQNTDLLLQQPNCTYNTSFGRHACAVSKYRSLLTLV
jgi:hypothetical protein